MDESFTELSLEVTEGELRDFAALRLCECGFEVAEPAAQPLMNLGQLTSARQCEQRRPSTAQIAST
jgi:hypothetical protein